MAMQLGRAERRRGRRADVQAPLMVKPATGSGGVPFQQETAQNVSLAGVYFETDQPYRINDAVIASVSIPAAQTRSFPFTRLAGRSRVVRVNELPDSQAGGRRRFGVALEFGDDLTALTALPR